MNIFQIRTVLKREYPMLLLDGVTYIEPRVICRAYKNLSYNEWFFPAHFPNRPIMPGTLQLEAFTQAVALPLLVTEDVNNNLPPPRSLKNGMTALEKRKHALRFTERTVSRSSSL